MEEVVKERKKGKQKGEGKREERIKEVGQEGIGGKDG